MAEDALRFSLIVATLGRIDPLRRLFSSLREQTCKNFEVVIVDQNGDDRLAPLVSEYSAEMTMIHLTCSPGLSKARNAGLQRVTGDVIAFPDDDCWYPKEFLETVAQLLNGQPQLDGCTGRARDPDTGNSFGRWGDSTAPVTRDTVFESAVSFTIFLRKTVTDRVGKFDETLGVGSGTKWGSGEETDYLIRSIDAGSRIQYFPELEAYHPSKVDAYDVATLRRASAYGRGFGRVLRQHRLWKVAARSLIRALGGTFVYAIQCKPRQAGYHWRTFVGRLQGLLASPDRRGANSRRHVEPPSG